MLGSAAEGTSTYHRAFRLVYDAEAKIFEFDESLPRAAVFSGATLAAGPDQALALIKDPSLDVWRTVVVERQGLDGAAQATLAEIASRPAEMARPATIESYDSQRVVIRAETSRPGVLLLTDSNYPGWKVSVDGKPARLLAANYLFRGVLLPAGTHRVEFRYAPASYRWGTAMSLAALGALGIWSRRRRRRPGSEPPDGGQEAVQRPQSATKLV